MLREPRVELSKRLDRRAAALDVRVVDHDVAKRLCGVDGLQPRIAAGVFVCGPAAALVLVGQDDVDAVFQTIHRNRGSGEVRPHVLQSERRLETLGGTVRDGPPVVTGAERPRTLADVTVPFCERPRAIVTHLGVVEVAVRCLDARAVLGGQSRGGDGLHCKRTVPELAAVVTLHLHAVLGQPQIVGDPWQVLGPRAPRTCWVLEPAAQHVHHLVDGPDVDVARVLVLIVHVLHGKSERHRAQRAAGPRAQQERLYFGQAPPQHVLKHGVWVVEIFFGACVAGFVPVDTIVLLHEQFLS
mmetsp:Transcript_2659/g.6343  ORF Transcript_2659/g.6343 Transcript_2659/m.6343 type:complete len:299 (+) Transcript_2659:626-1522(+)